MKIYPWVLAVAFIVVGAQPALGAPEDVANDISSEIMSPFCPGVTLHDCASDAAVELRNRIEGWARDGWSRARIMDELVTEYGADIRATPPTSGSGLLAWVLPGLAIGAGLGLAWITARRWSAQREPAPGAPTGSAAEQAQIEAELAVLRGEQ